MKINNKIFGILFLICINSFINAQSKSNFEIVDSLIKDSVDDIVKILDKKDKYYVNFTAPNEYSTLKMNIIESLQRNNLVISDNELNPKINYKLEQITLHYSDVFRDGLFGSFLVNRYVKLMGISKIGDEGKTNRFEYSISDTVLYSDISQLENIAYSFTSSEIPDEPFFSSAFEPAIVLGSTAIAVYLFFNIRGE